MKKMKVIRNVLVVLGIVFMSTVLCGAGCKNASDDDGLSDAEQKLVGTWKLNGDGNPQSSDENTWVSQAANEWYPLVITLNSDRSGSAKIRFCDGSNWTTNPNGGDEGGNWSASGSNITLNTINSGTVTLAYTWDSATLKVKPWAQKGVNVELTYTK